MVYKKMEKFLFTTEAIITPLCLLLILSASMGKQNAIHQQVLVLLHFLVDQQMVQSIIKYLVLITKTTPLSTIVKSHLVEK